MRNKILRMCDQWEVPFFGRFFARNLFLPIIIIVCMGRLNKRNGSHCPENVQKDIPSMPFHWEVPFLGASRMKPLPTYHNFLPQDLCRRNENSETARKMYRKTFLVSSSNGKCHFSEDFRPKPLPTSDNFLLQRSYAKNKNSDAARKIYRTRFFVCASSAKYHFSVGFLHETSSSLS